MWIYAKTLVLTTNRDRGFVREGELVEWVTCALDVRQVMLVHGTEDGKTCIVHLKTGAQLRLKMKAEAFYQLLKSLN